MATNAPGLNSLATIIKRLEAATSRLEDIALAQGSAANVKQTLDAPLSHQAASTARAPPPPSASATSTAAPIEDSQAVKAFDELIIAGKLNAFVKTANDIGGPVKEQGDVVVKLFQNLRHLIVCASASAKPSDSAFMTMLGPLQAGLEAVNTLKDKHGKERDLGNHFAAVSEGAPAVGWVTVTPKPAPYVGEYRESAAFYANRVLQAYKDKDQKHVDWSRAFLALLDELKKYVAEHHTTGLAWNPKGGDATQFKSGSASASSAGGPPAPPPPPPPPPPGGLPAAAASSDAPAQLGGTAAVFAEINRGGEITKGLRKVNKDEMTHKNPTLRTSGTVPAGEGPKKPSKPAKPVALQTKKPPKLELVGTKWSVENYENDSNVIIEETSLSHVVNIFNCKNSTIQIKGKINGVTLFNCKKTSVLIDSLVASLSITSSASFTVQITGVTPTIQVDNSDSGQIYLSKDCLNVEILTAKSSAINVSIPEEGAEEGVFVERAIPEMLRSTVQNGKLVTNIVEHSG